MVTIPDDLLSEADRFYRTRLRYLPRLNFDNAAQVLLLRPLMPIAGALTSPVKKLHLGVRTETLAPANHSLALRIIEPYGPPKGLVVDIHGGGWTALRAINDDRSTAPMACGGLVVVSVDYRYAPDHPLGEVIQDCDTALGWALCEGTARFGVNDVFVHGDSAGAHLSLVSALRRKGRPGFEHLKGIVLFYGPYDLGGTPSARAAGRDTLVLYGPSIIPVYARVTGEPDKDRRRDPRISPLYADLASLRATLIIVGTADPLLDDGLFLRQRMSQAGVDANLILVPNAPHSFNRLPIGLADFLNGYVRSWMSERTGARETRFGRDVHDRQTRA